MRLSLFHIAAKNLTRNPLRTLAMTLGMASISAVLITLSMMYISIEEGIEKSRARLGADAIAVPSGVKEENSGILLGGIQSPFYMKNEVEDNIKTVDGVEATSIELFIVSARLDCCSVSDTTLIGFDPESDFTITPWLKEKLKRNLKEDELIIGNNILAGTGGRMKFYGKEFVIAGKLEPTGLKYIDSAVFVPIKGARKMVEESASKAGKTLEIKPDEISAVLIGFKQGVRHDETAVTIEHRVKDVKVLISNDVLRSSRQNLALPLKSIAVAGVVQWATSLFLISVLFSLSAIERRKEMGLLRAMGAQSHQIRNIFLYETLFVSGAGGFVGIAVGEIFILSFENLIKAVFNVPYLSPSTSLSLVVMLVVFVMTLLTGLAVTISPIIRESSNSPSEIMSGD